MFRSCQTIEGLGRKEIDVFQYCERVDRFKRNSTGSMGQRTGGKEMNLPLNEQEAFFLLVAVNRTRREHEGTNYGARLERLSDSLIKKMVKL